MTSLKLLLAQHIASMPIDYGARTYEGATTLLRTLQEQADIMAENYIKELSEHMNAVDPARRRRTDLIVGYDVAVKEMLKFLRNGEGPET